MYSSQFTSILPMLVNPYAVDAFVGSRNHPDIDIRRMVRDEFLSIFMEIVQVGIDACDDFKTVNMYHIANSDSVHDYIRDYSSLEVLVSESSPRANRLGISVVPGEGVDVMQQSAYHDLFKKVWFLRPNTYVLSNKPSWLPRFRRLHISDVIALHHQNDNVSGVEQIIQSDTFFLQLRNKDELDEFMSIDGYAPLKRMKVMKVFADKFWKLFQEIFPPYGLSSETSLSLIIRPGFNDETKALFDSNFEKGKMKLMEVSQSTKNILDRLILGFDNIQHGIVGERNSSPTVVIRYDINQHDA